MTSIKKLFKNVFIILIIMLLVFIPSSVNAVEPGPGGEIPGGGDPTNPPTPDPEPEIKITKIVLEDSSITIINGESYQIKVNITYSDGNTSKEIKPEEIEFLVSSEDMISVSNSGKITTKALGTGATVKAKSKDGSVISNECTVTVKEKQKSSDASITSLEVTEGRLSETFKPDKTEYTYIIPTTAKITENNFKIKTAAGAKVIKTNITSSKVTITVQAEDGSLKSYTLTIKKEKINLNLKSLGVKGYTLKESFNPETLVYNVTVPYEAVDVSIEAKSEDSNAKISIKGATNLDVGENIVNVVVSDGADDSKTYKIIVTREKEEKRKETGNSTKYSNPKSYSSKMNFDSNNSSGHTLRYVFVTVGSLILLAIGGFGIYFYIVTSKKQLKKAKIKALKEERISKQKELVNEVSGDFRNKENSIEPIDITKEFRQDEKDN